MSQKHTHLHPENMYLFPGSDVFRTEQNRTDPAELAAVRFVRSLGIRPNLSGYRLLISSIVLVLKHPHLLKSLTHELYPAVAAKHGCSALSVERNIRKAIDSAYEYDPERIRSVFYFKVRKPYISEALSLAAETIRFEAASPEESCSF